MDSLAVVFKRMILAKDQRVGVWFVFATLSIGGVEDGIDNQISVQ